MNAIQKMQKEGTLNRFCLKIIEYNSVGCPIHYGLDGGKCNFPSGCKKCWKYALKRLYDEGVND